MLPASVLGAGAFVGIGLYLGLRAAPVPTVVSSAGSTPAVAVSSPPKPSVDPLNIRARQPDAAPAVSVIAPAERAKAALASLDAQRKRIVEKCVTPALAKQPEPKTVKLTFNVTFGADGKEIGRGVAEDRATSRADVTACVQQSLAPLSIPASDSSFTTDLTWELP